MGKKRNVEKKENVFESTQLLKPDKKDYIVAYFDPDYVTEEDVSDALKKLAKAFPNNNIITLPRMVTLVNLGVDELKLYRKLLDKAIAQKNTEV